MDKHHPSTLRSHSIADRTCAISILIALSTADAALAQGQLYGWGNNSAGHIQSVGTSLVPYLAVSGGGTHVVALKSDGTVTCWGGNASGQSAVPTGLSGVRQVDAGSNNSIAVKWDGTVEYWGADQGQGDVLPSLPACKAVASGFEFSMALTVDGLIRCWGANDYGQCTVPKDVGVVKAIDAGDCHGMALAADGRVRCWGAGQAQSGNFFDRGQSIVPSDLVEAVSIAAGRMHSLALRPDGTVRQWGWSYGYEPPADLNSVTQIAAGSHHSLALRLDGTVRAWGDNVFESTVVPDGLSGVVQVAGGGVSSYALRSDGSVVQWGRVAPPAPATYYDITEYSLGEFHVAALRANGAVVCWGNNSSRECEVPAGLSGVVKLDASYFTVAMRSDGSIAMWGSYAPSTVPTGLTVRDVAAGDFHLSAVLPDGTTGCWGANFFQQLQMPQLSGVEKVAAGSFHTLALHSNGTVTGWGYNNYGQSTAPSDLATQGQANVTQVSGGLYYSLALRSNGTVRSWGYFGQSWVSGLANVIQVSAGGFHALALKSDGKVVSWGIPNYDATTVPAGMGPVTHVEAGSYSNLVLLSPVAGSCANPAGAGRAELLRSGRAWQDVAAWSWSEGGGPQVPGALTSVDLGEFGSVGSVCEARCGTLTARSGSTLIVPVDLTDRASWGDRSITVGGSATLAGRVWLVATGATALPDDLNIPVLVAGDPQGIFDVIQSTVPPPPGKFLALVSTESLGGGTSYSLQLLSLPTTAALLDGSVATGLGTVVAAESMDWNGDGFDDLALAVDFDSGQDILQVLINDGRGNLGSELSVQVTVAAQPKCLAVGDVNQDGRTDAVLCIGSNQTGQVYLNAFGGSTQGVPFTAGATLAVGGDPLSAIVIPPASGSSLVQGPGGPSVGIGSGGTGGSGTSVKVFNPTTAQETQPSVPVSGRPNALVRRGRQLGTGGNRATNVGGPDLPGFLALLTPNGQGVYAVSQEVLVPGVPVQMDCADIDGDGYEDLVSANAEPAQQGTGMALPVITLFRGGSAQVSQAVPIAPENASAGLDVALVDADGDGDRDIVSVHVTVSERSGAALIQVDTPGPGSPLTIGSQTDIDATRPVLCTRGDLDGGGGEDLFVVDRSVASLSLTGGGASLAIPLIGGEGSGGCTGDVTGDGQVEGKDLATLLAQWDGAGAGDLDGSGLVNGIDLAILLTNWGPCR